jgi:hypothetical protein
VAVALVDAEAKVVISEIANEKDVINTDKSVIENLRSSFTACLCGRIIQEVSGDLAMTGQIV